ncbi:MAG: hypothetical protein H7831_10255 [Magnetococcus sp. WYHC-3]
MIIAGVDAALRHTGIAIMEYPSLNIVELNLVKPKSSKAQEAIIETGRKVLAQLQQYNVERVIIEEPDMQGSVGRLTGNMSWLMAVAYFIAGLCECNNIRYILVPVQVWKGQAPKQIIYNRLTEVYHELTQFKFSDDRIDAIGLARWGATHFQR